MPFVRDARTALLIVDMDNDNCTGMYTVYNPQEYLENAVRLRQACYDAGVPVVQVKQTYEPLCRGHDAPLQEVRLEDGVTPAASLQGTPGWQIVDDLDPGDRDIVVLKHRWDGFFGTKLPEVLRSLKAEQLVLIGGFTDACLLTTAFSAYCCNYPVALVADAASCSTELSHKMAVLQMVNWIYDCTVFTTENFVLWLEGRDSPSWYAGIYNTVPANTCEEIDHHYSRILAGSSGAEGGLNLGQDL